MSSTPAPDRTSIASEALHRHPTTGAEPIADEPQAPAALQSAPTAVQAEPSFIGRTSIAYHRGQPRLRRPVWSKWCRWHVR
jgi:hypothetical protein